MRISPISVDKLKNYDWYYSDDKKVFRLLRGLFSGNSYVSVRFDGKVIEIFNKTKDVDIRDKNWNSISKALRDVI